MAEDLSAAKAATWEIHWLYRVGSVVKATGAAKLDARIKKKLTGKDSVDRILLPVAGLKV